VCIHLIYASSLEMKCLLSVISIQLSLNDFYDVVGCAEFG